MGLISGVCTYTQYTCVHVCIYTVESLYKGHAGLATVER